MIAHIDFDGRPATILNSEGDAVTPSVVLFDQNDIVVGKEAAKAAVLEPDRIADFPKRDIGRSHYSRTIGGKSVPPEVIQSLILEKLKQDAELQLGPIEHAVITVPAYFDEPRRKATQDAAQLAELNVLDLINEPTAAAIAYGTRQGFLSKTGESQKSERILVYDLGGGTFDVTLMEIDGRNYTTLATAGDVQLGGLDWDRTIIDHVVKEFQSRYPGCDPRESAAALQRLQRDAEEAKRTLSMREQAMIAFEHEGNGIRLPLSRMLFESLTAHLMDRTLFTVRRVLKDVSMGWQDVTRLLLVGGSTRMPEVQRLLEQESGLKVDRSMSADEAVAHGAAIYANLLLSIQQDGATPQFQITNVNSHDLGVLATNPDTGRSRRTVIVPRNSPLPIVKSKRFRTQRTNQRSIAVRVVEGGDSSGRNATPIGKCVIRDLPPGLPAGTIVNVQFKYAANGRLTVRARLEKWNRDAVLDIERDTGLTDAKLYEWSQRLQNTDGPLEFNS